MLVVPIFSYWISFAYVYFKFGVKFESNYAKAKKAALMKALDNEVDERLLVKDF